NWIANGLGVVLGFITPLLFVSDPTPGMSSFGLTMLLVFSALTVLFYLPSIIWIREPDDLVIPKRSIIEETRTVVKNKTYVGWFVTVGVLSFALSAITAQIVGFAQEVLLLTTLDLLLPPALALLFSIMIFLFIWIKMLGRIGKGKLTIIAMAVLGELIMLVPLVGELGRFGDAVLTASVFFVIVAACMAVYYLMSYIVPADITHVDSLKTGMDRAGMYEGFKGIPLNVFQAIASLFLGWFMAQSVLNTGNNAFGLTWWGPLFAPFLFLGAIILIFVDIDPNFQELKGEKSEVEVILPEQESDQ
ncbi:MAG: hypothetical protein P1Q69_09005, partial [Candidatus Thorarchaeota archaeon]|nr:hypothetical protein [Candidatus Thorarchaeota archaeon]